MFKITDSKNHRNQIHGGQSGSRNRGRRFARGLILPLLTGLISACATLSGPGTHTRGCTSPAAPEATAVKVAAERDGASTRFFVENNEYSEITMTLIMSLVNLKGDVSFPYTATFPPRKVTEAFALSPIHGGAKWAYSYTNYYKLGSNCARHDDSFLYELPYSPGAKFKVTQGYNGKYSHTGSNQYAIDWQMPEGTLVRAARGGVVVRVKDDSDTGGPTMDYDCFNNYILIRHSDGTRAHYCHLQKDGCLVKVGQIVVAGDFIAHSGNTGFSSGPHLHFCVFKTKDGRNRLSVPVRFKTSQEASVTLLAGKSYRAPDVQTTTVRLSPTRPGSLAVIH